MDWKYLEVKKEGRVAVVRFDRGDRANALSLDLMSELLQVACSFEDDLQTTVVVLTGSSTKFTAGIDLKDPKLMQGMQAPMGERRRIIAYGPKMCAAWENMEQFTIVAVEGHCVGGGVSLAVSCDYRIMGNSAFFRVPELILGMNMSWQTLPRLVHLVGPARVKQIVILAERISAEESLNWGLAQDVVNDGDVLGKAIEMAHKIADQPPLPVKMTKKAINAVANALDDTASFMDIDQFMFCQLTEDYAEAVGAFLQKRKPTFKGQ